MTNMAEQKIENMSLGEIVEAMISMSIDAARDVETLKQFNMINKVLGDKDFNPLEAKIRKALDRYSTNMKLYKDELNRRERTYRTI